MLSDFCESYLEETGFFVKPSAGRTLSLCGVPLSMLPMCSRDLPNLEDENELVAHLEQIIRGVAQAAYSRRTRPTFSNALFGARIGFGPVEEAELVDFIRYLGGQFDGDYFEIDERCRGDYPYKRLIRGAREAIKLRLRGMSARNAPQS